MIKKLKVSNYALIDSLQMSPDGSFSILTGETGAGKSIVLGALGLVMGERADLSAIRDKSQKCVIELHLDIRGYDLEWFFEQNDLEYDYNTIIRREIHPNGKSRSFVNDSPTLLSVLSELSGYLIDIHSQGQAFSLSQGEYRLRTLDTFSTSDVQLTLYKRALGEYRALVKRLQQLKQSKSELVREDDYNRFLLNELIAAKLTPNIQDELEKQHSQLSNAQKIRESLSISVDSLNQEQFGAIDRLTVVRNSLSSIAKFLPEDLQFSQRLESVYIELKDISTELTDFASGVSDDPQLFQQVESQLDVIYSLQRKHQVASIAELINIRSALESKVLNLENIDSQISEIENQISSTESTLKDHSTKLYELRVAAAAQLSSMIEQTIKTLGMPSARFEIQVDHTDDYFENGSDRATFMFSANKGSDLAPVEKTASGGEMSRIMLALKCALAQKSKLPTIIFDEIDTGVSGDVADRMAWIMQQMSQTMQVLAITHLGQVAARGKSHFKVYKVESEDSTNSQIVLLSTEERIAEIAGMISGSQVSQSALDHARELLRVNF